ncbi:MAG: hypothetical protein GXP22_11825 [Gammaproteobacteria bacterium]|nr:hypothetical protein [Gammaproteobacteria bacterium]
MIVATTPAIMPNPQEPAKPPEVQPQAETRRPPEPVSKADAAAQQAVRDDENNPSEQSDASQQAFDSGDNVVYTDPRRTSSYSEVSSAGSYIDEYT